MSTPRIARIQAGVPDGGQFAPNGQAEAEVNLPLADGPFDTPLDRAMDAASMRATLAERDQLRAEAKGLQDRADAVEMQLIAQQLRAAYPNATHVYVMEPDVPGRATVELYDEFGGGPTQLRPRTPQLKDDDVASRLVHLAARRDSPLRVMMGESDWGDGMGVPVDRLADAAHQERQKRWEIQASEEKAREKRVADAVLRCVPDAVSWNVSTVEWENGYFHTPEALQATTADGTDVWVDLETLDGDDVPDLYSDLEATLLDLSTSDGPLGERSSHEADIDLTTGDLTTPTQRRSA